jgi:hypothetical protein
MRRAFFFNTGVALLFMQPMWSQTTVLPDLFNGATPYTYFVGSSEPDTGWNRPDYDDTSWLKGNKSIGYGDGDDSTIIAHTSSVYLRIPFSVADKSALTKASLMLDYDDGFVAYLNGHEIARKNLGNRGEYVPYDRLTDRSHEAYIYRQCFSPIYGYYLNGDTLSKYLNDGGNLLAFQVHNDSADGSDLSFNTLLLDISNGYYDLYDPSCWYIKQVPLDSTYFPIVVINTDEYGFQRAHTRYKATMGIIDGKVNRPTDPYNGYNGNINIEIRGKSSADFPKKSYGFETQNSEGENLNVPLLGLPAENDWILYGPYTDKSLIRNEIGFILGRKTGRYQPRTKFCELILNGDNMGLYVLTEKIKRDSNRVNISRLRPTDISGDDLTGGYLFTLENGVLEMRDPDNNEMMPVQKEYIRNFYKEFISILDSPFMADPYKGYRKYIDEQSLIDYIIVNEAIKNCDAYYLSDYAYKDRDDKDGRINYGPLWDNDLAFGNSIFQNGFRTNGWQFEENKFLRIIYVMRDTSFTRQLAEKWHTLRTTGYLKTDTILHYVDSLVNYISDARIRNYEIWPIIDKSLFYQYPPYVSSTYDKEMEFMKDYIIKRLAWIDDHISTIHYDMPSSFREISFDDKNYIYPNPFTNDLNIIMDSPGEGTYNLDIMDITGRIVFSSSTWNGDKDGIKVNINGDAVSGMAAGIYVAIIRHNGMVVHQQKIIKNQW